MGEITDDQSAEGGSVDANDERATALIEALQSVSGNSLSIAQNFNDFFTHVGREASRKREQHYIEPFCLLAKDLYVFDSAIRKILGDFGIPDNAVFDCNIGLENRRVVSFQSVSEVETLPDADKSHPESIVASWTYFYPIKWRHMNISVPYKIQVSYYTNPRKDIVGSMSFAMAPEQIILIEIQGPHRVIQSLNEELDSIAKTTFLPPWWRYPKCALQYMEPYLGFAIYGATISTVFIGFQNYEKWTGKSLLSQKTEEQLRKEILTDRDEYKKKLQELNDKQKKTLDSILHEKDVGKKIDSYVSYQLDPIKEKQFPPIEELFKDTSILPVIGLMFLAFIVAGIFHMVILQIYKRLTPPSVIAIGRLGRRRLFQFKFYDWVAITLIGVSVVPVFAAVAATIYEYFLP